MRQKKTKHVPDAAVKMLRALGKLCSKEESRYSIQQIYLERGYAYATNGHICARFQVEGAGQRSPTGLLDPAALRPQPPALQVTPEGEIIFQARQAEVKPLTGNQSVPNIDFALDAKPEQPTITAALDLGYLINGLLALKAGGATSIDLTVEAPRDKDLRKSNSMVRIVATGTGPYKHKPETTNVIGIMPLRME